MRSTFRAWALSSPPIIVIAVFVGVPIVYGVLYTVGYTGGVNSTIALIAQHQHVSAFGLTVGAYADVFGDGQFWRSLGATVFVTVVSTAVVLVVAWLIGLAVRFSGGRLAHAIAGLSVVPMFIPVVIGSYSMLSFYGTAGFVRTVAAHLGWADAPAFGYTLTGVVLGSVWLNLPFAVLMITSGLGGVPDGLVEAARDVGAGAFRRFATILVPMTGVPTVIAATFTAITVLGSFTLPYIVGPTAPNLLGPLMSDTYTAYNTPQQAEVEAIVVFALAAFASVPYLWANFRSAKSTGAFT